MDISVPLHLLLCALGNVIYCIGTVSSQASNGQTVECTVQRLASQDGLHRTILSEVSIPFTSLAMEEHDLPDMLQIILEESLPSGLYVDTDELASLLPFNGPAVLSRQRIDVEKPEFMSSPTVLYIFYNVSKRNGMYQGTISYPIHLRYHRAKKDADFSDDIVLLSPQVLVKLPVTGREREDSLVLAPCDPSGHSHCKWTSISCDNTPQYLSFKVPVGHSGDTLIVVFATLLTTLAATAFIGFTMRRKTPRV